MNRERQRREMIADIEAGVAVTRRLTGRDRLGKRVLQALWQVHREDFVPSDMRDEAFRDGALPIGHGQTISQPYMVAVMTELLDLDEESVVLEIGTGSGYQAAILSCIAERVYSIERIPDDARRLSRAFAPIPRWRTAGNQLHHDPKTDPPHTGDAWGALENHTVPPKLIEQLKPGGRMVIPVGMPSSHQELMLVTRDRQGETHSRSVMGVAFVPMVEEA